MKTGIYEIAIITDSNRSDLRVICSWKKENHPSFESPLKAYRYVWVEQFQDIDKAVTQLKHINTFARIQLEKVIRRQNPNWLSLCNKSIIRKEMEVKRHSFQSYYHDNSVFMISA